MPLYQFTCDGDDCFKCYEIFMSLKELEKYDRGKFSRSKKFNCPTCGEKLRKLIAPVRLLSSRCTAGY